MWNLGHHVVPRKKWKRGEERVGRVGGKGEWEVGVEHRMRWRRGGEIGGRGWRMVRRTRKRECEVFFWVGWEGVSA